MKQWRAWTTSEEDYLKKSYATMTAAQMAEKLNRTTGAVKFHLSSIGVLKPRKKRRGNG